MLNAGPNYGVGIRPMPSAYDVEGSRKKWMQYSFERTVGNKSVTFLGDRL